MEGDQFVFVQFVKNNIMIFIIHGKENFNSTEKLKELIIQYQDKFEILFLNNLDHLKDSLSQKSIFKNRRVFIIKNIISSEKKSISKEFTNFLKIISQSEDDILVFFENEEVSLPKNIQNLGEVFVFNKLSPSEIKKWLKDRVEKKNSQIKPSAIDKLIEYKGNNLWALFNEIEKLTLYKKDKTIDESDVKLLVHPEFEGDIFKMIDFMTQKRIVECLKISRNHLENGDSVFYLLSMINFQFRNLILVKMSKTGENLKMHPYVFKKTINQVMKFSEMELKNIYHKMLMIDVDIKTGKIDPEIALDLLILDLN